MKVEKILLPYDDSTHSMNAAKCALDLAKRYGAHVSIVHCYEAWDTNVTEIPANLIKDIKENKKQEALELLKKVEKNFENQDIRYTVETMEGEPGQVLASMSKSGNYDLIVMGSHGHSDLAGLFLGSVTHKVLNTIYCPVLVVP